MADADTLASLARLVDVMARLRAPGGCPWDREQTHDSLRPYVIEEAYEVLEAIEGGDPGALCDELGDLLLQVLFHAEIAAETGAFRLADVARAITDKLVRRHPHVFGDVQVRDADEVVRNWRRIKAEERRRRPPAASSPARWRRSRRRCPPSPGPRRPARRSRTPVSTGPTWRACSPRSTRSGASWVEAVRRATWPPQAPSWAICSSRSPAWPATWGSRPKWSCATRRAAWVVVLSTWRRQRGPPAAWSGRLDDGERDRLWKAAKA